MGAITERLATISPISSGNYPSYSRLLLRNLGKKFGLSVGQTGSYTYQFPWSGQQEGQQFV